MSFSCLVCEFFAFIISLEILSLVIQGLNLNFSFLLACSLKGACLSRRLLTIITKSSKPMFGWFWVATDQFIDLKYLMKLSLWNFEKSLFRFWTSFFTNVSLKRFSVNVNCRSWSDMEVVRFREVYTFSWELIKILSSSVEEVPVILVGKLIWGVKLFEKNRS